MLTRRTVLAALVATPVLARLGRAEAGPRPGQVYRGRPEWDDHVRLRGARVVPLAFGGRAVLGAAVRATNPHVYSIANTNNRYAAWFDIGRQRRQRELFLILPDATAAYATSGSSRYEPVDIWFEVTPDHAAILAEDWSIERRDRTPLDGGLVTRWQPRAALQDHTGPIQIELVFENRGTFAVIVWTSPFLRDNFTFTATENGVALPAMPPMASTGPMGLIEIAAGKTATITGDLAQEVRITRGGVYAVTCEFRASLTLVPINQSIDHAHERWDFTAGTGAIEVRVE